MECSEAKNLKICTCTYQCSRRGKCCECIIYHKKMNELPGCYFSKRGEATYDRSIEAFIRDYQGRY